MPPCPPDFPIVNIHASRYPNEAIEIIGNKAGLERLINVLIDAVSTTRANAVVCTHDGFAAEVRGTCLEGRRRPEEWRRSGSPRWDVDDPMVARILELTEENDRLRRLVGALRQLAKPV
jgi:hypothetical protein